MWETWYGISVWYEYVFKKDYWLDMWISCDMCVWGKIMDFKFEWIYDIEYLWCNVEAL